MRRGCIDWYIYGDWDADKFVAKMRDYSPILAGALFGAAWWCIVDAICYSRAVLSEGFPWTYALPGVAATIALVCMNLISREELRDMTDEQGEEEALTRARCWLFFSYMVAFGSIAGAVAVLLQTTSSGSHIQVGVAGLLQTGFIIMSGLLLWAIRTPSDDAYALAF